jgi:hypothetical protein
MKLNIPTKRDPVFTHEGAKASHITPEQALRRSVMSCLLWEQGFYESGQSIADRIVDLVGKVDGFVSTKIADEARNVMHLRHVPLLIVSAMAKHKKNFLEGAVLNVVQRADELCELLAVHAAVNGVTPDKVKKHIPAAMKRGLAKAFTKFSAYDLAKYNRDGAIKLRDVLFMVHAKPKDDEQAATWKLLIAGALPAPDTW